MASFAWSMVGCAECGKIREGNMTPDPEEMSWFVSANGSTYLSRQDQAQLLAIQNIISNCPTIDFRTLSQTPYVPGKMPDRKFVRLALDLQGKTKTLKISREKLLETYQDIKKILKNYMDLQSDYYSLIALWIIGTYLHKQFSSYPYLFFNAMKGSGKTRLLKIVSNLAKDGKLVGAMTEAVLFRTANLRTLCIDELESINAKGNENLRLLLNAAYKKGMTVERLGKKRTKDGEEQVLQEFEVYCALAMANIRGLENVLADRCITLILERSEKKSIIKIIENFDKDPVFARVRNDLYELTKDIEEDSNLFGDILEDWNFYIKNIVNEVSKVNNVNNVSVVSEYRQHDDIDDIYDNDKMFSKINESDLCGRDLELFFPLFVIADMLGEIVLEELIKTAQTITKYKRRLDREENRDIQLIEFIAQSNYEGYIDVADLIKNMKDYFGEDEIWINSRGISRSLNRLKLILDRRSTGKNRQIKIDILKARDKILIFKDSEDKSVESNVNDVNVVNNVAETAYFNEDGLQIEMEKIK